MKTTIHNSWHAVKRRNDTDDDFMKDCDEAAKAKCEKAGLDFLHLPKKNWICMKINDKECPCKMEHGKHKQKGRRNIKVTNVQTGKKESVLLTLKEKIQLALRREKPAIEHTRPASHSNGRAGQQCVSNMQFLCMWCNMI